MIQVKAFKCSGCNKVSLYKQSIKKHELTCPDLETNKACKTCFHSRFYINSKWVCDVGASKELKINCESHKTQAEFIDSLL